MQKMKDSGVEWIGEIPEGWEVSKLKFSAQIISGSTPNSNEPSFWNGDINWITPKDLNDNRIISSSFRTITKEGYLSCGTYLVPKNSVVLSTRAPIGAVGIAGKELCTNQGIKSILCKEGELHYKFLYYYLLINDLVLNSLGNGTTFLELSTTGLENLEIPCPSFKEQCRVVEALDVKNRSLDNIRGLLLDEIQTLEAYKKSVITEAVTKGLDKDAEMKDSEIEWIGEIPKYWEIKPLKHLASINDDTLSEATPDEFEFDYIDIGSVEYGKGILSLESTTFSKAPSRARRMVRSGDIIVSTVRTYLKAITVVPPWEKQLIASTGFAVIRSTGDVEQEFLNYAIQSEQFLSEITKRSRGVSYPAINTSDLAQIKIVIPGNLERIKIVAYLDKKTQTIDEVIAIKRNQLSVLDEYKKSLIYEYVTGKREV